MKYLFLLTVLFSSLNSFAQSKSDPSLFLGIETFSTLSSYEGFILAEQGHYPHLVGEAQIDDLSLFVVIGPMCQMGFRSHSDFIYTSFSYSINTTNQSFIEHGAMIEIGWYLDFGARKELRLSIGSGLGFHVPNKPNVMINGGWSRLILRPLGFRIAYNFKK